MAVKNKTKTYQIRLTQEQMQRLKKNAAYHYMTPAQYVRAQCMKDLGLDYSAPDEGVSNGN